MRRPRRVFYVMVKDDLTTGRVFAQPPYFLRGPHHIVRVYARDLDMARRAAVAKWKAERCRDTNT